MHTVKQRIVALALGALLSASAICSANGSSNGVGVVRVAAVHTRAHKPSFGEPDLRSSSVLIVDETHAATLYARRADAAMPIASITKLMTALVVMDAAQPLDEMIEISRDDSHTGKGSFSRLTVGTKLARGDLLHLALMSSENRAAQALGRHYPGGLVAFVQAMNARAKALGMQHSHFVDPAGLSSENVASPVDLTKLVMAVARNRVIREYSTDKAYTVRAGRRRIDFRNTDSLVSNPGWNIVVQKTGYITEAGKCLVMQAIIDGRTIVSVLLDSYGKYTRVADAKRIKKWMEWRLIADRADAG